MNSESNEMPILVFLMAMCVLIILFSNVCAEAEYNFKLGLSPSFAYIKVNPGYYWGYRIRSYGVCAFALWKFSKFDFRLQYNGLAWQRNYIGDFNTESHSGLPTEEIQESVLSNSVSFGISRSFIYKSSSPYLGLLIGINFASGRRFGNITKIEWKSHTYWYSRLSALLGTELPINERISIFAEGDYCFGSMVITGASDAYMPASSALKTSFISLGITYILPR